MHRDPHQPHCGPNFWISASARSFGDTATDLNRLSNRCFTQRLCIGIYREEFNTFNALTHHVFNSITAAAADADDFNHRVIGKFHWFKHSFSPICACRLEAVIIVGLIKIKTLSQPTIESLDPRAN